MVSLQKSMLNRSFNTEPLNVPHSQDGGSDPVEPLAFAGLTSP